MCGPDMPTSFCMITTFVTPLLMKPSLICSNRTVAWQARTFRRLLLLKSFRTMLPTSQSTALHLIVVDLWCRRFAYGYALDGSEFPCYLVWPQRDERSYVLLDTATSDTLVLDEKSSFRPLGMQHFCDSFALVFQIGICSDALELFGLYDDELLPDLHITRAGVLRAELGAHQEHLVDQDAHAADRKKLHAGVINVVSHKEVDTDSGKDESIIATSDSEESDSASETEQNEPASSLASDSEQYERMQAAYAEVGRDFKDNGAFIGSEYHKSRVPCSGGMPCKNTGEQYHPRYPLPGHEACSTEDAGDKCRCKSQLRSHERRLRQAHCGGGVSQGIVFGEHQGEDLTSASCWQSTKDGQVFYERGQYGTHL